MFESVAVEDLLSTIDAHDFTGDPVMDFGAARIDAVVAYERIIRAAQARQLAQINACMWSGSSRARSVPLIRPVGDR
jgi:hypothetical protein